MLRHDHVAFNYETIAPTDLFQNLQKQVPVPRVPQQRAPLEAAGGDKVQIPGAVVTVQSFGHEPDVSESCDASL